MDSLGSPKENPPWRAFSYVQFFPVTSDRPPVTSESRLQRLARLRATQNPDGGWGYFPGKQSWLEPTCYALFALYKDPESASHWTKGWNLIRSWQNADGGWKPNAVVPNSNWASALCVTLHCVHNVLDAPFFKGVEWLVSTRGTEGSLLERAVALVNPIVEYDRRFKGWPWSPEASSWIEPTAHSLLALRKARGKPNVPSGSQLAERIQEAERMLADRRSKDGGWNYGNRRVLSTDLPSYPETTGVALLGLQGSAVDIGSAIELAQRYLGETPSRLAKAWLTITLRNYGRDPGTPQGPPTDDLMITALEALSSPQGGHQWLTPA